MRVKEDKSGSVENGKPAEQNGNDSDSESVKSVNIFEETIVEGKRRHFDMTKSDETLDTWLEEHFDDQEGYRTNFTDVYDCYIAMCVQNNIGNALEQVKVKRFVKSKFPSGFVVKESSALKDKLKATKVKTKEEREKKAKEPSRALVTKDNLKAAFEALKFPRDGCGFKTMKKQLTELLPLLDLEEKPQKVMTALNSGVYNGYVELLRGVGKLGRYRWYDPQADEQEENEAAEAKKAAKEAKDESSAEDGEKDAAKEGEGEGEGGDASKEGEKSEEEASASSKPKLRKRKAASVDSKKSKAKKKKKNQQKKRSVSRAFIVHSDPLKIEETFPLAMTFMAEPKKARFAIIHKYLDKYYRLNITPEKILKTLETMDEKGYLEKTSGSGKMAEYQLTLDSFDPTDDDDLIGKIVNAITASVHPKECSVNALKSYVVEFYPQFGVKDHPFRLRKALERAVSKDLIRQISGCGMSGSYRLVENFVPTPVILAGKDMPDDYESDGKDEDDVEDDEGIFSDDVDVTAFQDKYQPRATKRRGKARAVQAKVFDPNEAYREAQRRQAEQRRLNKLMLRQQKKRARKDDDRGKLLRSPKKRYTEESDEDSSYDSEEADTPPKKRGRKKSASPAKPAKSSKKTAKSKASEKAPKKKAKKRSRSAAVAPPKEEPVKKKPRGKPRDRSAPVEAKPKKGRGKTAAKKTAAAAPAQGRRKSRR